MMANSEVAVLASGLSPNARRNTGTMMVPPPMPRSPDSTPTKTPPKAGSEKAAKQVHCAARLPYSAMFRRISLVTPGSIASAGSRAARRTPPRTVASDLA